MLRRAYIYHYRLPLLLASLLLIGGAASLRAQRRQNRARTPERLNARTPGTPIHPKVLVLNFDPVIRSEGGKRLHEVAKWNDPHYLAAGYAADLQECSGNYVQFDIVEWKDIDAFPLKKDGFRYTEEEYLRCMRSGKGWHQPDAVDYQALIKDYRLAERVKSGEIDEVWMFSMPYSGCWESTMAGRGAYDCNSSPVPGIDCPRIFVVMGFNYERGVGEMLEDQGHRTEAIMSHVYGKWEPRPVNMWSKFTLREKDIPGGSACGNVHFAPNSTKDYEWGNKSYVWSTCDDWLTYPNLTGKKRLVSCSDWGNGYIRSHHKWWLTRLPKAPGLGPDGKQANWWKYTCDFNRYPESSGRNIP